MLSCYDCIHCGACSDAGDSGFSSLKEDVSECKHFKNKADVVEVKYGEWIEGGNGVPCHCSLCGAEAPYHEVYKEGYIVKSKEIKTPYCPDCGQHLDWSNVKDLDL